MNWSAAIESGAVLETLTGGASDTLDPLPQSGEAERGASDQDDRDKDAPEERGARERRKVRYKVKTARRELEA